MLLKNKEAGNLIKVLDLDGLINPNQDFISGQGQAGQEEQNATEFSKNNLVFPSGEELTRCWIDPNYTKA